MPARRDARRRPVAAGFGGIWSASNWLIGAEVIKIEDPKRGDPLRAWQTNGVSVHWKVYSRDKKSVALNPGGARARIALRPDRRC